MNTDHVSVERDLFCVDHVEEVAAVTGRRKLEMLAAGTSAGIAAGFIPWSTLRGVLRPTPRSHIHQTLAQLGRIDHRR